jgi:hypothetical protein
MGVTGSCESCHNGVQATGKNPAHILTMGPCEACHATNAWAPATRVDHAYVTGSCDSCHNGTTATGKDAGHVLTTMQCDSCHRTNAWLPASFVHSGVTGTCDSCHNGSTATGKDAGHFVTTQQCDRCHTTNGWLPASTYSHLSPNYPNHGRTFACTTCHTTNSESGAYRFPAYQPDCAGCHQDDFRPDAHKKADNTLYTVSELRDCAGSCHIEGDFEPGEHRPTNAEW